MTTDPDRTCDLLGEFTGLAVVRAIEHGGIVRAPSGGFPVPCDVAVLPPAERVGVAADTRYHQWFLVRGTPGSWLVAGPFLPFAVSAAAVDRVRVGLGRVGLRADTAGLRAHYASLPVLPRRRQHACLELAAALAARPRERRPAPADGFYRTIEGIMALRRAEQLPTYDYFAVKRHVREGLLNGPDRILFEYLRRTFEFNIPDLIKGDPLRTRKDLSLTFLSVLVKTAIEEGLEIWRAFMVSDHFLVAIENAGSPLEIDRLLFDSIARLSTELRAGGGHQPGAAVRSCLSAVDDGLSERVRLKDLAAKAGISSAHLSRLFRDETGTTFRDHVTAKRLAEARRLLLFTGTSCAEIASLTGFSSPSHFVRSARLHWGVTPARLRAREGRLGGSSPAR